MFFFNILPKSVDIEVQKHAKRLDDYLLSQFLNFPSIQLGYWAYDTQYPKLKSDIPWISGYRKFRALWHM
jgi:hypothetical protein